MLFHQPYDVVTVMHGFAGYWSDGEQGGVLIVAYRAASRGDVGYTFRSTTETLHRILRSSVVRAGIVVAGYEYSTAGRRENTPGRQIAGGCFSFIRRLLSFDGFIDQKHKRD